MKATGIVRRLDQLGRIVIPKELRTTLDLKDTDPVEIFTEGDTIILRKYQPSCIFCGEAEGLVQIDGKNVCRKCVEKIKKL
ncbi:MAG: AbrB/MazE/SpoVT family DNA-binding domain-containing protein [Firmicutes bacterium]|nr:AbrB/MazE/SpoVT family DNA-binding domain-containing protein [Bacillota bacterium]MBQ2042867.1 AbrB/MazE/SpoVT family DNA-binding domain-containing protein [Bacillota bacterium]MBQ5415059.1 AbrB/MazE/SpoVT family DNA-binding domain-containing protein [Bacillota bacterium]